MRLFYTAFRKPTESDNTHTFPPNELCPTNGLVRNKKSIIMEEIFLAIFLHQVKIVPVPFRQILPIRPSKMNSNTRTIGRWPFRMLYGAI